MTQIMLAGGKGTLGLGADGILHLVWAPGSMLELQDAAESVLAVQGLSFGRMLPLLIEITDVRLTPAEIVREPTPGNGAEAMANLARSAACSAPSPLAPGSSQTNSSPPNLAMNSPSLLPAVPDLPRAHEGRRPYITTGEPS
nr:hypothetical protein [Pseudarthrobacter albicanus]